MVTAVEEGSDEEERQVKGYYASMQSLFEGADDIVVCKTIVTFMAGLMVASPKWQAVIPGVMNHMDMAANVALTHHRKQEPVNGNEESTEETKG